MEAIFVIDVKPQDKHVDRTSLAPCGTRHNACGIYAQTYREKNDFLHWRYRHQITPKRWYVFTNLHDTPSRKGAILKITSIRKQSRLRPQDKNERIILKLITKPYYSNCSSRAVLLKQFELSNYSFDGYIVCIRRVSTEFIRSRH
jgi:hypothetical protein